jgi:hypothetical protein
MGASEEDEKRLNCIPPPQPVQLVSLMSVKEMIMRSLHIHDVHVPKGPNLFALSVGEVVWFSLAIFFFLLSWFVGGDEFMASIGGNIGLAGLVTGLLVGAILCALTRPEK